VDLGGGVARSEKPGSFKTAEHRVSPTYLRIRKLEADGHMNHHCAGIARRHREALDSTQQRLLINGIGIDHHSLKIHQEKRSRFWFDREFAHHGDVPMFDVVVGRLIPEAANWIAPISR